jgi:hypothetical protein
MKVFLSFLLLLSFIANDVIAADKGESGQNLPNRADKGCFVVASRVPWKAAPQTQVLQVKSGPFVIAIPSNIIEVSIGGTVTVFRYDNIPHIVIGTETKDTFQLTSTDISLSKALEVIFTKTPKNLKIANKYGKELWNELMTIKKGFLERSGKAFIFEKRPLTIYFIPDAGKPFNNIAWAVDTDKPNSALRIESNVDTNSFKNILFSIKPKEK